MCVGIPGQVVALDPHDADLVIADVMGIDRLVHIGLVEHTVAPGDWVLVFHGFGLCKINESDARAVLRDLRRPEEYPYHHLHLPPHTN